MVLYIISITVAMSALLIYFKPVTIFFEFQELDFPQLSLCIGIGFISVIWFELVKLIKRMKNDKITLEQVI